MTYSLDLKALVLHYNYNTNLSKQNIAKIFNISQKTLYNWRKECENSDLLNKSVLEIKNKLIEQNNIKNKTKYKSKLTDDVKEYIKKYIDKRITINIKKLLSNLRKKFDISIKKSTLYGWISNIGYSYKNVNKKNMINCNKRKKKIRELKQKVQNLETNKTIISMDESHFRINEIPNKGWGPVGKKIYKNKYNKQRKGCSLLLGISKNKVYGYMIKDKAINGNDFTQFVKEHHEKDNVYLIDNASIHRCEQFKEFVKENNIEVIYNIPYNPETNPIEHCFFPLKNEIKKRNITTYKKLKNILEKLIKKTNVENFKNYFEYSLGIK